MVDMNQFLRNRFEESASLAQERNERERRMVIERLKERARAAFTGGGGSPEKAEVSNDALSNILENLRWAGGSPEKAEVSNDRKRIG